MTECEDCERDSETVHETRFGRICVVCLSAHEEGRR